MDDNLIRINKALADAGICSRRKADELVAAGRVAVNGKIMREPGQKVCPGRDSIAVDGKKVEIKTPDSRPRHYLMLNKPVHTVCTASDPDERKTVFDILPEEMHRTRLFTIGRLDYFSEGLLLLTDDGPFAHRLTHPAFHIPRKYLVLVREKPDESLLEIMRRGMTLREGERLAPVEVSATPHNRGTMLNLTLSQGINRQIRRMCRDLDLTILRLVRMGFGPLNLGDLPPGQCRPLSKEELEGLRSAPKSRR